MGKSRHQLRGFTLIEILLTVALVSLVSLAVFRVFSGGIKLWSYSQRSGVEGDISIFFDKFAEDLRHAFYYKGIVFNGSEGKIVIPTFVRIKADAHSVHADDEWITQIGAVKYDYDYETHSIRRSQANYSQALQGRFAQPSVLVAPVLGFRFIYYLPSGQGLTPYTKMEEVIPPMVFVEIKYFDGRSERIVGRMISIPTGL